jgi:hypothetical protein
MPTFQRALFRLQQFKILRPRRAAQNKGRRGWNRSMKPSVSCVQSGALTEPIEAASGR